MMIPFGPLDGCDLRDQFGVEPRALGIFSSASPPPALLVALRQIYTNDQFVIDV